MLLSESKEELSYFSSFVLSAGKCKQLYQRQKNVIFPFTAFPLFFFLLSTEKCRLTIKQFSKAEVILPDFPGHSSIPFISGICGERNGMGKNLIREHAVLLTPATS